jgi:hypothetical protein
MIRRILSIVAWLILGVGIGFALTIFGYRYWFEHCWA